MAAAFVQARVPDRVPTLAESRRTAAWLATCGDADGAIGWERRRHVDAWNHTESAMALDYFLDQREPSQPAIRRGRAVRYIDEHIFYEDGVHL